MDFPGCSLRNSPTTRASDFARRLHHSARKLSMACIAVIIFIIIITIRMSMPVLCLLSPYMSTVLVIRIVEESYGIRRRAPQRYVEYGKHEPALSSCM